ncbi:MAG: zinc ribbon domain-containing protein [Thermoplasmata archaeon]|nr:zinc ribbon domain-containing protein [Thermoplasmata archaeon]
MKDSAKLLNFKVNRDLKFTAFRVVNFGIRRPLSFNNDRDLSFTSSRDLGFGKRGVVFRGYVCPVCKAPVAKNAPKCDECGVKFEQPKAKTTPKKTFAEQLARNKPKASPQRRSTFQCPGCGKILYVGAERCPDCSTGFVSRDKVPPPQATTAETPLEAVFCGNCNYRIPPTDRFCRRCGSQRPKGTGSATVSWDEYKTRGKDVGLVSWDEYTDRSKGG